MKQSEQSTTRKKEELNNEIAVRLVPQGCFGGGTVHWGGRPRRHRGQALRCLQSLDEVWPCGGIQSRVKRHFLEKAQQVREGVPQAWRRPRVLHPSIRFALVAVWSV